MKIALIGYGRMGHEIEQILLDRGHEISAIIDIDNYDELNAELAAQTDVAIEFTVPDAVIGNLNRCFELKLPVVAGTTGWHNQLGEVEEKCKKNDCSLFYASNFSVGVNLFFALNEKLAEMMDRFVEYDVSIKEAHHTKKLDAPSGTAVTLAETIQKKLGRKKGWTMEPNRDEQITIEALREGDIKGIHSVKYDSEIDYIEFTHFAKSRKGFATGAVLAAEYLAGKKGIFTMRDLLGI